jgi:hypothetical protein
VTKRIAAALLLLSPLAACAPKLTPPGEATRVSGAVKAKGKSPVQINVYERCSPRFYVFERCPGRLLGEAKIARPGKFVIEVDPESPDITVVAFRGDPGDEKQCVATDVPVGDAKAPLKLKLEGGPCQVTLPK